MKNPMPPHDFDTIRQLTPGLVLFARQRCRHAEDVVQDALLKLFRLPEPPSNIAAWMYQVVRHATINSVRSESRRKRHEQIAAEMHSPWFDASPGQSLDAETASKALQSQPVELREVVVARIWGGLTFDQIGELVGTSSRTASRRYQAGLLALRDQLKLSKEVRNS